MSLAIFSGLDGTLPDAESCSFEGARPALERIRQAGIPLILVSSKTRTEMEASRELLDDHDPFIVENGGAIVTAAGTIAFGGPDEKLVDSLRAASDVSGCPVRGCHQMGDREVSEICGLPMDDARRARQSVEILDQSPGKVARCWRRSTLSRLEDHRHRRRAERCAEFSIVLPSAEVEQIRAAGWNVALIELLGQKETIREDHRRHRKGMLRGSTDGNSCLSS